MYTIINDPWTKETANDGWINPTPKAKKTGKFSGTTHITLLIDRSGSMDVVKQEVVTGVNEWLATMRKEPGSFPTTIVLFDTSVSTPVFATPVAQINDLTLDRYKPGGFTALNDAIAQAIESAERRLKPGDRSLTCIVTDGQENASRTYPVNTGGTKRIRELIATKEAEGNWTFTYLSAAPDAFADAASYGIHLGNVGAFAADSIGTQSAFNRMATSTRSYVGGATGQSVSFYGIDPDEDAAEAPQEGTNP